MKPYHPHPNGEKSLRLLVSFLLCFFFFPKQQQYASESPIRRLMLIIACLAVCESNTNTKLAVSRRLSIGSLHFFDLSLFRRRSGSSIKIMAQRRPQVEQGSESPRNLRSARLVSRFRPSVCAYKGKARIFFLDVTTYGVSM